MEPLYPGVASAQADEAISVAHARVITSTVHALPAKVKANTATSWNGSWSTSPTATPLTTSPAPHPVGRHPEAEGPPDSRSYAQPMHDALQDTCVRLLRSGTLPDVDGVPRRC